MTHLTLRRYTEREDPYRILTKLEQFLKEKNTEALMSVLRDDMEFGHMGAVTKSNMLACRIQSDPIIQQELFAALMVFDIHELTSDKDITEMIYFLSPSLASNKKELDRGYITAIRTKWLQDFRAGKLNNLSSFGLGKFLIEASHASKGLSETEVDQLIDLKGQQNRLRAILMYDYNPIKALDFLVTKTDTKSVVGFVISSRIDEPEIQMASVRHLLSNDKTLFDDKLTERLHQRICILQSRE